MNHYIENLPTSDFKSGKKMQTHLKELTMLLCQSYEAREIFLENGGRVTVRIDKDGKILEFDNRGVKEFRERV